MSIDISLLIDATRQSSRFLHRDYFELEYLQSASKNTKEFCSKSYNKTKENLLMSLEKYYKKIVFTAKEALLSEDNSQLVLVEVLDCLHNLERALPFFGMMLTTITNKQENIFTEQVVVNFPLLNEIYYAQKGKGAWVERHSSNALGTVRLRTSANKPLDQMVICSSIEHFNSARKISSNIRCFDSALYSVALLISGKVDLCFLNGLDASRLGIEILIKEAGGHVMHENNMIIASNFTAYDSIKHLL